MTRFARAKGSKASNERMPNDSTPWHIMKQQLEDNIASKSDTPEPKAKTAKQLLNEKDDPFYYDTTGNVNNDWAEIEPPKNSIESNATPVSKKSKKGKILENENIKSACSDAQKTPKIKSRKIKDTLDTPVAENSTKIAADSEGPQKKSGKRKSNADSTESTSEVLEIISIVTPDSKNDKKKLRDAEVDNVATTPKIKTKKRKSDVSPPHVAEVIDISGVHSQITLKKTNKKRKSDVLPSDVAEVIDITDVASEITLKKTSKKRKSDAIGAESIVESSEKVEEASEPQKKKKKKRKDKKNDLPKTEIADESEIKKGVEKSTEGFVKISKRQKRNQKRKNKMASETASDGVSSAQKPEAPNSGGFDAAGNEWSSSVNFGKQKVENKLNGTSNGDQGFAGKDFKKPLNRSNEQINGAVKRKAPKIRDDKEHKRRKPQVPSIKCTINGMDVEIVQYDGFPVKKEDAERLKDLRQQMKLKGIPSKEINAAMKLERRKAEKSLSRIRRQVCFHCRKAGHNLSDCPELGEGESATGICFKCGSTEHTHFECKVQKKQEYGFASCFICREQGHIAKQCPDNPKGLYPQGGSCKVCGDVTHLRKDCPELTKEKEENSMTLETIAESNLESLDVNEKRKVIIDDGKKAKVVKF